MTRSKNLAFTTPLKGNLALCDPCDDADLHRIRDLYKFIWVREGRVQLRIDHIPLELHAGELVPLTPHHRLEIPQIDAEVLILAFDSNFYCIFGHDGEMSCSGLLFNGTSELLRLELNEERAAALGRVIDDLRAEYEVADGLREEMLRMQLKRFIILCTRFARERFAVHADREKLFDIVRRYYVLVDEHFRTRKRVQDYAGLLNRSPKTLANLFAAYDQPSPLSIIRDRVNAEARRLLLYTSKSAKEIAYLLGYEDTAAFSRFFAKMNGESITAFRRREKRE
ncbi:helix-turn-helix domain-containing protein [uncultured Alistipes sp.]|uniref:AraC family transcriptional regulator n=1 Tax=uncultured Alistipes sp. TaxID=538949 RepID=UPI00266D84B8|nr:helix-turn-helix domain-containing protein [uncultured Alistipes sp.]